MKRQTAAALILLLVLLCPSAPAERAIIPYTLAELRCDPLLPVPALSTRHSEASMTTRVESSLPMDWATVNMDMCFTAVPLDEGGASFTYSTRGLKRQVGVTRSGTRRDNAYLEWVDMQSCPTERDALDYAGEHYALYASYGFEADPSMFWNVEIYGLSSDGTESLIETRRWVRQDDYRDVDDMTAALCESCIRDYPACTAFRFSVTDDFQGGWDLYAVGAASVYSFSGDDAYMICVGSQVSLHGRDGKPHAVYAAADRDLFSTDMECSGCTVIWKPDPVTGTWFADTVEATYEKSFTAKISAHFSWDHRPSLVGYDITFINEGVTYTVRCSPDGKQLHASAEAPFGSFVSSAPGSEWDWVNAETFMFETSRRLLPLKELTLTRYD